MLGAQEGVLRPGKSELGRHVSETIYIRRPTMSNTQQIVEVRIRFLNWLALACLAFLLIATAAHSQLTSGTILGTVTDTSGAALGGAKVTATNVDTGFIRTTIADSAGN